MDIVESQQRCEVNNAVNGQPLCDKDLVGRVPPCTGRGDRSICPHIRTLFVTLAPMVEPGSRIDLCADWQQRFVSFQVSPDGKNTHNILTLTNGGGVRRCDIDQYFDPSSTYRVILGHFPEPKSE